MTDKEVEGDLMLTLETPDSLGPSCLAFSQFRERRTANTSTLNVCDTERSCQGKDQT